LNSLIISPVLSFNCKTALHFFGFSTPFFASDIAFFSSAVLGIPLFQEAIPLFASEIRCLVSSVCEIPVRVALPLLRSEICFLCF
jgi:hypothetical protein